MTRIFFHVHANDVPTQWEDSDIHVHLYGSMPAVPGTASIGHQLVDQASRLGLSLPVQAFDFLSIAMAVTAADSFVLRDDAPDRWSRDYEITLPLADPEAWDPVRHDLQDTLRFLSGDVWKFNFLEGGKAPPSKKMIAKRTKRVDLSRTDCACLFSGGMDSALGALRLIGKNMRPMLISHAYGKDRAFQDRVSRILPRQCPRFSANAYPTWEGADEDSMRTRSFNFLAYGALAACAIAEYRGREMQLFIPENGMISINAPLTPRRIGSHSTRTTHPFYLQSMQSIFDRMGLPVTIFNPFRHMTKGEMLAEASDNTKVRDIAVNTVSCGKWKRDNMHCGRCPRALSRGCVREHP